MGKVKKGDLIYIPSSVRLVRKDRTGMAVDYVVLKKPASLLVVGVDTDTYEVLYNRKNWFVEKRKAYGVKYD